MQECIEGGGEVFRLVYHLGLCVGLLCKEVLCGGSVQDIVDEDGAVVWWESESFQGVFFHGVVPDGIPGDDGGAGEFGVLAEFLQAHIGEESSRGYHEDGRLVFCRAECQEEGQVFPEVLGGPIVGFDAEELISPLAGGQDAFAGVVVDVLCQVEDPSSIGVCGQELPGVQAFAVQGDDGVYFVVILVLLCDATHGEDDQQRECCGQGGPREEPREFPAVFQEHPG